ncbi:5-oxoprolinase subunit PxpB [Oleiagrimonas sp. C23AA]|uniref:5-oxoprolinase subunit PxpB n=1 Tax=Oleiagrimonas sp. C23AA TaxID=2719047 RepID=UPI001F0D5118|nr:5-oxoprolinase subunit PxpB [Oleiagrimonas sp. C23AA]
MEISYEPMSASALLLRFGQRMDATVNAAVHAAAARIRAASHLAIRELVPAYASLLVRWHMPAAGFQAPPRHAWWEAQLRELLRDLDRQAEPSATPRTHRIQVNYGGEVGADLEQVARHANLSVDEVIARHTAPEYQVAMIGFAPGFAYLLGLDEALHTPRREAPRTRVPAGAVAIGGAQTGVYPSELPGGWQLIGHTDTRLFDPADSERPCLLAPGDRVRFVAKEGGA